LRGKTKHGTIVSVFKT
jgi:hypothetical protein